MNPIIYALPKDLINQIKKVLKKNPIAIGISQDGYIRTYFYKNNELYVKYDNNDLEMIVKEIEF